MLLLLISIPLIRPLHQPDPRQLSDEEQGRLATVQAIVEHKSLAIEATDFRDARGAINSAGHAGERFPNHYYSNQPPMLALLLSGPYWVMQHYFGMTLSHDPDAVIFWLTLFGVTLPAALSAGIVYRMSRAFELPRPLRALLSFSAVAASGLVSYSTVLNAHAPAAALLLASAASLLHVIAHNRPKWAGGWLLLCGLCAALAATIDPPAVVFLLLLVLVVAAMRWPLKFRLAGVVVYALGAALPLGVHARFNRSVTGDLRPGLFHPELAIARTPRSDSDGSLDLPVIYASALPAAPASASASAAASAPPPTFTHDRADSNASSAASSVAAHLAPTAMSPVDDDDEATGFWHGVWHGTYRIIVSFFGGHGLFSHFPVLIVGILGVTLIMHRHWPSATKMLAGVTLGGALLVILFQSLGRPDGHDAMFATRWFVVFGPLTLFWAGAWLRRTHRPTSWIMAGSLLAFSMMASLVGATGPLPRNGFDRYTLAGAWRNLLHHEMPSVYASPSPLADRGAADAIAE